MELRVETESGSIYILNQANMTWERVKYIQQNADPFFPVRTAGGELTTWPEVEVGKELELVGPPLNPAATFRYIKTSPVIRVENLSVN